MIEETHNLLIPRKHMLRFLLKLTISIFMIFTAFSIAARALGATQPPNSVLAGFTEGCEGKPQPCWYGIVPGITTLERAEHMLQTRNFHRSKTGMLPYGGGGYFTNYEYLDEPTCKASIRHYYGNEAHKALEGIDTVDEIMISQCRDLTLGDLIDVVGQPQGIRMGSTRMGGQAMIVINNKSTLVGMSDFSSPSTEINTVFLFPASTLSDSPDNWHGFNTKEQYCQMHDVPSPPCYCQAFLP